MGLWVIYWTLNLFISKSLSLLPFAAPNTAGIIAGVVICILLVLILLALLLFCCCRARNKKKYEKEIAYEIRYYTHLTIILRHVYVNLFQEDPN